jgi:hypothetical protein
MNKYNVQCPGCDHFYNLEIVNGLKKLIHPGYTYGDPKPHLPTSKCVPFYGHIIFKQCNHCCPETFAICPECNVSGKQKGTPSDKAC